MRFLLINVFLSLLFQNVLGQYYEYNGVVIDSETHSPLAYVNVGIIGKNIGTVTNSEGEFTIALDTIFNKDTLRISMIGYSTKDFVVANFKRQNESGKIKILLTPKTTILNEVIISSKPNQSLILGNKPKSRMVNMGFIYNKLGHEIGSLFKMNGNEIMLDSIQLNFAKCNYENVYLRMNVYKIKELKDEAVLQKPIYISLNKNQALNKPIVDLSNQNIIIKGDFIVSIEIVKDLGEKGLYFYADLNTQTSPSVYRVTSQGNWIYATHKHKPVGISILAFVH
jgi:hypothetical protein